MLHIAHHNRLNVVFTRLCRPADGPPDRPADLPPENECSYFLLSISISTGPEMMGLVVIVVRGGPATGICGRR